MKTKADDKNQEMVIVVNNQSYTLRRNTRNYNFMRN